MSKLIRFLLGITAGVSLGLLFAPKKGKELRNSIAKSDRKFAAFGDALMEASREASGEVKKLLDSPEVQKALNSGRDKLDDLLDYLKDHSKDLSDKAKREFSILMEDVTDKVEDVKEKSTKAAKKTAKSSKNKASSAVKKAVDSVKKKIKK